MPLLAARPPQQPGQHPRAKKGQRVAVLERGRRISTEDMERAARSPLALFWMPRLGLKGFFVQQFYRHLTLIGAEPAMSKIVS